MATVENNKYYYVDSSDIGIVVASTSATDIYSPINTVAAIKLYGKYAAADIATGTATDSSIYNLIPSQYHVALYYKTMAEIFPNEAWLSKYWKIVGQARGHNNPVSTGRIQQHDF